MLHSLNIMGKLSMNICELMTQHFLLQFISDNKNFDRLYSVLWHIGQQHQHPEMVGLVDLEQDQDQCTYPHAYQ